MKSHTTQPGVYIHIPFCEQRCHYCAFTVAVSTKDAWEPYVRRLIREIELSGWKTPAHTIFLGGGTPSILPGGMIERILRALPSGADEISLEANPGTLDPEKLASYRSIGVNRISLGAQSFADDDLRSAGRIHSAEQVVKDFDSLRQCGFDNINIDLIAGLPHQRLEAWNENLAEIGRLRPEHVSIYVLELDEQSPWFHTKPEIPADEQFVRFYEKASEELEEYGYVHYEISNWAQPGYECRHNLKYWTGVPYRGFGVGAHSYDGVRRFWNTTSLARYASSIDAGDLPVSEYEVLTREQRIEEAFMLGLRRTAGVDIREVAQTTGIRYPSDWFVRLDELKQAGLVTFDGGTLKLTSAGWLVANGVIEELLCPSLLSTSAATP